MQNTVPNILHVVAAVIRGNGGQILLAQRPLTKHQGGKWEFPGGKVEQGESPQQALQRELNEELAIIPQQFQPLIKVTYQYPERTVLLDVWEVSDFSGTPFGQEGQPVAWFSLEQLASLEFPPANLPIITAAQLPALCLITPEPTDPKLFLATLEQALKRGVRLVQFRAKSLADESYMQLALQVIQLVHTYGGKVLLNTPPQWLESADGLHLTSKHLIQFQAKDRIQGKWLSASCHNQQELAKAEALGVDFVFLAPVLATETHPKEPYLGWEQFTYLVKQVNTPVYALGGLSVENLTQARTAGAQGIAAIRSLWDGN